MKKALVILAVALAVPGVALANNGKKGTHSNHSHAAPKVMYVLKGTLSGYTPYDASTSTNGSITIVVKHSNRHGRALKGMTLTFAVSANTKIVLRNGVTSITDGDRGIVKIRALKNIPAADLAATLQAIPAWQVIDHGAPSPG